MLVIIGCGRIGMGPVQGITNVQEKRLLRIAQRKTKWEDAIASGKATVVNDRNGASIELVVVDSFSKAMETSSMNVLLITEDVGKVLQQLVDVEAMIISVGAGLSELTAKLPKMNCPILLFENNYELAIKLMKNSENDIRPCVLDCYSPRMDYNKDTIIMDFDSHMDVQVYDPDGKVQKILGDMETIVYCDSISQLDVFHYRKYFGINVPHRILAYLALEEARRQGVVDLSEIKEYITDAVMDKYFRMTQCIVKTSFFAEMEKIQCFYDAENYDEAYEIYTNVLDMLIWLTAQKTVTTGDTFNRVIKWNTPQYLERLDQTRVICQTIQTQLRNNIDYASKLLSLEVVKGFENDMEEIMDMLINMSIDD